MGGQHVGAHHELKGVAGDPLDVALEGFSFAVDLLGVHLPVDPEHAPHLHRHVIHGQPRRNEQQGVNVRGPHRPAAMTSGEPEFPECPLLRPACEVEFVVRDHADLEATLEGHREVDFGGTSPEPFAAAPKLASRRRQDGAQAIRAVSGRQDDGQVRHPVSSRASRLADPEQAGASRIRRVLPALRAQGPVAAELVPVCRHLATAADEAAADPGARLRAAHRDQPAPHHVGRRLDQLLAEDVPIRLTPCSGGPQRDGPVGGLGPLAQPVDVIPAVGGDAADVVVRAAADEVIDAKIEVAARPLRLMFVLDHVGLASFAFVSCGRYRRRDRRGDLAVIVGTTTGLPKCVHGRGSPPRA
ncbi:MAG: hypothetical protein K2X11_11970 [Acetobacteraceae bacterium]|nr:hypothetical protein [Acetobacteraceae bacterium]